MPNNDKPIGVFDSGLGGLTVARAISHALPHESITYVGDTKRCPYGPRDQAEVRLFVRQVGAWLERRDVKFVVVACNTATAAGLDVLQRALDVPVIGVIEPGARAAVQATRTRRVGVLATQGSVDSGAYPSAIHMLDAGVGVTQQAAPVFVDIVERKLTSGECLHKEWMRDRGVFDAPDVRLAVEQGVAPLMNRGIDTVVLGCTHFPLLSRQIRAALGDGVRIVSSAEETCRELAETLERRGDLASADNEPTYRFASTSDDITSFAVAGSFIFGHDLDSIEHIDVEDLEALADERDMEGN
ncbi:MAG: glutamate racemase [Atopobiaceae bacterium]|nr:glutamate racemase [Atopobiaceae bacterium]MCI2173883.1 glutamate racemase [Atopobiaceae bacterium]MCI2208027.1 glutamate racemase [Atopobiaceae bacterium]